MNIMVIIAHPDLQSSRANRALALELKGQPGIAVRDLYREYPNGAIDAARERELLFRADRVIFQFPFYWYSCPPLLKQWFDEVLTFGWAFGPGGDKLKGKEFILATTTGGPVEAYRAGGGNWFTVDELMRPIQTALLRCNGTYLPAFVAYSASGSSDEELAMEARRYAEYILAPAKLFVH